MKEDYLCTHSIDVSVMKKNNSIYFWSFYLIDYALHRVQVVFVHLFMQRQNTIYLTERFWLLELFYSCAAFFERVGKTRFKSHVLVLDFDWWHNQGNHKWPTVRVRKCVSVFNYYILYFTHTRSLCMRFETIYLRKFIPF